MKVCSAKNCILPARWKPRAIVRAGAHWPDMPSRPLALPICFCEVHRASSSLDKLFNQNARQALDIQFAKRAWAPIDWSRSVIEWEELDPHDGMVVQFPPAEGGPGGDSGEETGPGGAKA